MAETAPAARTRCATNAHRSGSRRWSPCSPSKPGLGVQRGQIVVGLEGAVLVGRLAPRNVDGAGDMPRRAALCSCGRCAGARILPENSSGERTSTRFFSPIAAMTSSRNARMVLSCCLGGVAGRRRGSPRRWTAALPSSSHFLRPPSSSLTVVVAVQLEVPVRVGGEPVVVAAVEDHGVVVARCRWSDSSFENCWRVDEVAA